MLATGIVSRWLNKKNDRLICKVLVTARRNTGRCCTETGRSTETRADTRERVRRRTLPLCSGVSAADRRAPLESWEIPCDCRTHERQSAQSDGLKNQEGRQNYGQSESILQADGRISQNNYRQEFNFVKIARIYLHFFSESMPHTCSQK